MLEIAIQFKSGLTINVECKKHNLCEKDYIWNPAIFSWKNSKYLGNTMDDSVITCDKIIGAKASSYNEETNYYNKF